MTTSASMVNLPEESPEARRARLSAMTRPTPGGSLVASAQRISKKQVTGRRGFGRPESWQDDGWDMFDLVGEQRFLATTLAGRLSQAKFYVGKLSSDPMEPPEPLEDDEHVAARAFSYFGDSPAARAQMIGRMGVNLFVAGDGYLVGIPRWMLPESEEERPDDVDPMLSLGDLEWRMLSVTEVSRQQDSILLVLGDARHEQILCDPDDIFLIRVWRPHPRRWWQADSPTRSSLPVLRELVGLTMHISAQVDSRLAGAGVFIVPQSAKRALAAAAGLDPDSDEDPFTDALMEAMMTAISDRSSAAALVPLVVTVPDESVAHFEHITFANQLDDSARELRDEAIRRLALGQDAPPELLLGTGGMNHWGAWLVREDVVTTHLEPPLALMCDAITSQFLHPVLIEQGMDEQEAREYVVWYDVSHLVQRPNRLADAQALHDKGILSDETLREAGGFGDQDAPENLDRPTEIAISLAQANPNLIDNMPEIIKAFQDVLNPATAQREVNEAEEVTEDVTEEESTPEEGAEESTPDSEGEAEMPAEPADSRGERQTSFPLAASGGPVRPELIQAVLANPAFRDSLEVLIGEHLGYSTQEFAPAGMDTSKTVGFFLLPRNDQDLPGPEDPKHCTLLYLGEYGDGGDGAPGLESSQDLLASVANIAVRTRQPITVKVTGIEDLGDEGAKVWMFNHPDVQDLRADLLSIDTEVTSLHEEGTFTKYPDFLPHVTIGYPDTDPAQSLVTEDIEEAEQVTEITFDRLALWFGDEHIEFPLGGTP